MAIKLENLKKNQNVSHHGGQRIVVAMSGGVDSSVVAALLKKQGYDVIGITLQLYDHGRSVARKGACCAGQDIYDARRVADKLKIPHYVLNYEQRFAEKVITPFAQTYLEGETPIPCVLCNQEIKFKDLFAMGMELGAEKLATGHYIQLLETFKGPVLKRARDSDRDQSYFLYATERSQLEKLLFPLGGLIKTEVRALAREFDLPVAEKSDSQDICFVQDGHYSKVIQKLKPEALNPGDIVHIDGQKIGTHNGIIHFTVGQRKGIGVSSPEPLYVVRIDVEHNQIIVGPRQSLESQSIMIRDVNWLGDEPLSDAVRQKRRVYVRVRSSQPTKPAVLTEGVNNKILVTFTETQGAVAPGQACVFYSDESTEARVLGGGVILKKIGAETNKKQTSGLFNFPTNNSDRDFSVHNEDKKIGVQAFWKSEEVDGH